MTIMVEYGGHLKVAAGKSQEKVTFEPACTVAQALQSIARSHGDVFVEILFRDGKIRSHILTCVNDEQVSGDCMLSHGDRLLLLSPISGG